jgi:hypothetical protein
MVKSFICLIPLLLGFAAPVGADGFDELVAQAQVRLEQKQLEDNADWPTVVVPDDAFERIYEAWVAPKCPSPVCRGFLSWLGKDAATASLLSDLVGRFTPEECARLALSSLRWASARPALEIVSLGARRFPDDYRLGYLQAKLLEECGEFSGAIEAHLRLLKRQEEMPHPPETNPSTGQYAAWMALRPEPLTEIGGHDSSFSFWLGVNIGYDDALTSINERETTGGSNSFGHDGMAIAQMHYFIVPPNLESLRSSCLGRISRLLRELPATDRSQTQVKLNKLVPALGPYFPMFQANAFRPNWPWLIKRLDTNPEDRARILSLTRRFDASYSSSADIQLEEPAQTTSVGQPAPELLQLALAQFRKQAPRMLLKENAYGWSHSPVSDAALFCLQFLESTEPRADLAPMLPGSYSDLPEPLPPASLALIPRIDAMLEKWINALPKLPPVLRDKLLTCRLECLGKLADKTSFEHLAAQHPTIAKYDGEKPRDGEDVPPFKLPVPPASRELEAAQTMMEVLLPSNRYRQFDHLMTEANLRLGTTQGSWERFECSDAELLGELLELQRPHTALEMARVAEAYHLIGRDDQARRWFDRAVKLQSTHRWIRYRAGANLLAYDHPGAEALLKPFPRPVVVGTYITAAQHYHEIPNVNAAAMLKIAQGFLDSMSEKNAVDFNQRILGMFHLLNSEPYPPNIVEEQIDPWDTVAAATARAKQRPSIWSVAGGLTSSQSKQHEQMCDQFLIYLRNRPPNTVGYEPAIWVDIASRVHKRRGTPPQALTDDCVRCLVQFIGSNEEAPYWTMLTTDAAEFPGPFRVVFEQWMKGPEKLRERYVDVFKRHPNTNQIPALLEEIRHLKTCTDKDFPGAVIRYYANHPQIKETPSFLTDLASTRQFLHFSTDYYSSPLPDFMKPPSRQPSPP